MTLLTLGFPKSGCHALVKACELLGVPCGVEHLPFAFPRPSHTHRVFIARDPRNIVCSWLRFKRKPVTAGMFLRHLRRFDQAPLVDELAQYEGWLTDPETLVVRYEALIASDAVMRAIAAHLDVPYIDGAFEELPGHTRTWHADHSDYRCLWTPVVEDGWVDAGGPALLQRWGYADA